MAQTNPFADVKYGDASNLSIDANKLNFYKGFLDQAGGIVADYSNKLEANKLADFENQKSKFEMDGDVPGLQSLMNAASGFRDAKTQQKARSDLLSSVSTQASGNIALDMAKAAREGNLDSYTNMEAILSKAPILPEAKLKLKNDWYTNLPTVQADSATNTAINNQAIEYDKDNKLTIDAFNKTYETKANNNQIFKDNFTVVGGNLLKNANSKLSAAESEKIQKDFYTEASQSGASSFWGKADAGEKQLRDALTAQKVPDKTIEEKVAAYRTKIGNLTGLGGEAAKALMTKTAAIDAITAAEKAALTEKHNIVGKYTDAAITATIEDQKFGDKDLYTFINSYGGDNKWFSTQKDSEGTKKIILGLQNKPIGDTGRKPTANEIRTALLAVESKPWYSQESAFNMGKFETELGNIMKSSPIDKVVKENAYNSIKEYHRERYNLDAQNTADKLRAESEIRGRAGQSSTTKFMDTLQKAANPTATPAKDTTPTTSSTAPNEPLTTGKLQLGKNNPTNLKDKSGNFRNFESLAENELATVKQLNTYLTEGVAIEGRSKQPVSNLRGIVSLWRPEADRRGDKDISGDKYAALLAKKLNIPLDSKIDPKNTDQLVLIAKAIGDVESGKSSPTPTAGKTEEAIDKLKLSGDTKIDPAKTKQTLPDKLNPNLSQLIAKDFANTAEREKNKAAIQAKNNVDENTRKQKKADENRDSEIKRLENAIKVAKNSPSGIPVSQGRLDRLQIELNKWKEKKAKG